MTLRIATRKSPLAMWQAHHVRDALCAAHPGLEVELMPMTTTGDERLNISLASVGGKGLFLKELEKAMLENRADIAVHSMKDVPVELPPGLVIASVVARADPHDALVSNNFDSLAELPQGARVGTSSLRRQAQLRAARPDLQIIPLRGNLQTRLGKLDAGDYDAIILAVAGLERLELHERIRARLSPAECLPAIGQGIVGIEAREADVETHKLLDAIAHAPTAHCLAAERALNEALEGSCHAPIAAHATLDDDGHGLTLAAMVGHPDGSKILRDEIRGTVATADATGRQLAQRLLDQGAAELLAAAGT